ncbi:MAG: flagellar biosynthesis protein FlhF [Oscillospiraceae bacterium]|nr:flagellar biosynthesis protein FlhF [Oscillospiraceae bacterium]
MNIKRYVAATMPEAMEQIKRELGRDALILSQRPLRKKGLGGLFSKPMIEVVAAYENPAEPAPPPPPKLRAAPPGSRGSAPKAPETPPRGAELSVTADRALEALDRLSVATPSAERPAVTRPPLTPPQTASLAYTKAAQSFRQTPPPAKEDDGFLPLEAPEARPSERVINRQPEVRDERLSALENKIDSLSSSLNALAGTIRQTRDSRSYSPDIDALLLSLLENETHEEFAHKLAREVSDIVKKQQADSNEVMEQLLRQTIGQAEPIKLKRFKRTVVLLIGPTGVGKTTTLAKLAAIYSINHHAKVGAVTTDTYRIAAVEQLKTYAQILEIPLSIVYSPEEMSDALREHEDKDIVFIDTAGKSPSDRSHEDEVKDLIRHSDCDEVHLVLSATTSFTGLLNILNAYSFLNDFKIIVTKLDETPTWGTLLNARLLSDRPISYTAIGQNVPDDIEVADVRKIVARLMTRDP